MRKRVFFLAIVIAIISLSITFSFSKEPEKTLVYYNTTNDLIYTANQTLTFNYTIQSNISKQYNLLLDYFVEPHWVPLTSGEELYNQTVSWQQTHLVEVNSPQNITITYNSYSTKPVNVIRINAFADDVLVDTAYIYLMAQQ